MPFPSLLHQGGVIIDFRPRPGLRPEFLQRLLRQREDEVGVFHLLEDDLLPIDDHPRHGKAAPRGNAVGNGLDDILPFQNGRLRKHRARYHQALPPGAGQNHLGSLFFHPSGILSTVARSPGSDHTAR